MFRIGHTEVGKGQDGSGLLAFGLAYSGMIAVPHLVGVAGENQATLTWDAVPGALSYNLYKKETPGVGLLDEKTEGVTSPHVDTGLERKYYYYRITVVTALGESDLSNEVVVLPSVAAETPPGFFDPPSSRKPTRTNISIKAVTERLDPTRHERTVEYEFSSGRKFLRRPYE